MLRQFTRAFKKTVLGQEDMQELLDKGFVKLHKTKQYEADDYSGKLVWTYRFTFDNHGRKRRFMDAITSYPKQPWDDWVTWFDDFSNLNGEICVEARCMVPPTEAGKFRYDFEQLVTRDMLIKN